MSDTTTILLYALVAGLSPLALLSTLAVLGSGSGRVNGTTFLVGFLLGQAIVLVVAFLLGAAVTPDRDRPHETFSALLQLALGVVLLVFAWRGRRPRGPVERSDESRAQALVARLGRIRLATAFAFGALLGVGGVKRLTITLLAGATIGIAGLDPAEEAALAVLYVLIATALVWIPVGIYLVAGSRADAWTVRAQERLLANQQRATVVSTLVFGLLLIGHGVILLL